MRAIFLACVSFFVLREPICAEREISEKGYWIGEVGDWHLTDWPLARAIAEFLRGEGVQSVVDFGCGEGDYVRCFLEGGLECEGYDGNPETPLLTRGLGQVLDLSEPFNLGKTFDWVMSIEVGEHIPHQYERNYIENLLRHASQGIILSWAVKNQPGAGHFNCQDNDYIKAILARYGYVNDLKQEEELREKASVPWFKDTLMVFRKAENFLQ